jgi:hypothetical protein
VQTPLVGIDGTANGGSVEVEHLGNIPGDKPRFSIGAAYRAHRTAFERKDLQ